MSPKAQAYFSEARTTLALAFPIIIGQVSQVLMGITDSLMIGHAGKVPFAASAFAGNVFNLFFIFAIGLMVSVPVLVARAHGEGDTRGCGEFMRHGLAIAVVFSALEIAVLLAISFQLHRFDQPPEVVAEAGAYFRIVAVSLLPVMVFQVLRQYSEAMGHPWTPMIILLSAVGLNVVLNWLLIFGNLGAPALGLEGAGWATLAARATAAVALFLWLRRKARARAAGGAGLIRGNLPEFRAISARPEASPYLDEEARAAWPARWFATLERARLKTMLRIGVPGAGQLLFEGGAFTAAAVMMGWFGSADPLAAHQVAISCASVTFMLTVGIATAAGIRVSQCTGSGEYTRLRPVGLGALGICTGWMALAAIVISFGRFIIAERFGQDAAVTDLAAQFLVIAALFQIVDGMQVVGSGVLRGLDDVKIPTAITFVAYWLIALPLGYFYGVKGAGGPVGIWVALAAGLTFAGVTLTVRFVRLTRT